VTGSTVTGTKTVGDVYTSTASCTGGKTLIGGGVQVTQGTGGSPSGAADAGSYPSTPGVNGTWTGKAITTVAGNGGSNAPAVTAYAICAN